MRPPPFRGRLFCVIVRWRHLNFSQISPMRVSKLVGTICLCLMVLLARTQRAATEYDRQWRVVDSLEKAGLPESALTAINRIYGLARQEHNDGQEIKALIYRI